MTGDQIKAARERRQLTQAQLAQAIGVGLRTVGNWERGETVPKNRMAALEAFFTDEEQPDPLRGVPTTRLLAELMRRIPPDDGGVASSVG